MKWSKQGAALLSVASNITLTAGKVVVGIMTGSVSILSEAIHSGIDLLASLIALFSVRYSDVPADQDHPYGHGKIENVSGVIEGLLIFFAAGWIAAESIHKLIDGTQLTDLRLGVAIMAVSAVLNTLVSRLLYRVARRTDSVALEADAAHLSTDVITSAGVFAAVGAIYSVHALWDVHLDVLDPIIAMGVAAFILNVAWRITRKSFVPLLDRRAEPEEKQVEQILQEYNGRVSHFHKMRTRRSGSTLHVDLHMGLPGDRHLAEAHALSGEIKARIQQALPRAQVLIHLEPPAGDGAVTMSNGDRGPAVRYQGQVLVAGDSAEVKRLELKPGQHLRWPGTPGHSVRWIVVNGGAVVRWDKVEKRVGTGEEVSPPADRACEIWNPGREPLVLVEIQIKAGEGG